MSIKSALHLRGKSKAGYDWLEANAKGNVMMTKIIRVCGEFIAFPDIGGFVPIQVQLNGMPLIGHWQNAAFFPYQPGICYS
jgi:hypothetical protein